VLEEAKHLDLEATKRVLIKNIPLQNDTFSPATSNSRSLIKSRTPKEESLVIQPQYSHSYEGGILNSSLENAN